MTIGDVTQPAEGEDSGQTVPEPGLPDPMDSVVEKIVAEGEATLDSFGEGRKFGAFYAGVLSGSRDMGHPLSMSGGIALTETWMSGECWYDDDEPEEDEAA